MSKRVDQRTLYAYVQRLLEGEEFEEYVDNLPEDRRVERKPYEGSNKRKVIDLRYLLGRVMPTGHDFSETPEDFDDFDPVS